MTLSFYTQAASAQEKSKSIREDLKTTRREGTDPINAAVCQETKEIKDQLEEMNQSVDTFASSSGATNLLEAAVRHDAKEIKDQLGEMNQSIDTLRGTFFWFYNGDAVVLSFRLWKEICACFYLSQKPRPLS